jgi:hypothetical protein
MVQALFKLKFECKPMNPVSESKASFQGCEFESIIEFRPTGTIFDLIFDLRVCVLQDLNLNRRLL